MSYRLPRRGRIQLAAGVVAILVGLGCLGWFGYQYLGTNISSSRAFEREKSELRARWDVDRRTSPPSPSATAPTSASTAPTDSQSAAPPTEPETEPRASEPTAAPGEAIGLLRIPTFGPDYEIPILSGTDPATLARGVGHYQETALPGQIGNFAVAGHRVTHGEPFARLLELNTGDEVIIETGAAIYTYIIDVPPRQLTVQDTQSCVLDSMPCTGATPARSLLTLTTCEDLFQSADRSVGQGHLAGTRAKR